MGSSAVSSEGRGAAFWSTERSLRVSGDPVYHDLSWESSEAQWIKVSRGSRDSWEHPLVTEPDRNTARKQQGKEISLRGVSWPGESGSWIAWSTWHQWRGCPDSSVNIQESVSMEAPKIELIEELCSNNEINIILQEMNVEWVQASPCINVKNRYRDKSAYQCDWAKSENLLQLQLFKLFVKWVSSYKNIDDMSSKTG